MDSQSAAPLDDRQVEAAILATIPLGVFVLDSDGRFLYLNLLAERLFRQLSSRTRDQLLGRTLWEVCPDVADSAFTKEYRQAVAEQRTFELETYYPVLDRWFGFLASPAKDCRCFYFQDVTARARLERELRRQLAPKADGDCGNDLEHPRKPGEGAGVPPPTHVLV